MTQTRPDPAAQPRDVYERVRRAVGSDDREAFAGMMAVDAVIEWPFRGPGAPSRLEGRQAIRDYVTASALGRLMRFDELRADAVHETLDPEVIVVESTAIGHVLESGRRFELQAIAVVRIRDGEIVSYRDYTNPLAAAQAAGAVPRLVAALAEDHPPAG
jgi:ketosteroid isomerase-like protein